MTEIAGGELLICAAGSCSTESHRCFSWHVSAVLEGVIFLSVKLWHRWMLREDRSPVSVMLGTSAAALSPSDLHWGPHVVLCRMSNAGLNLAGRTWELLKVLGDKASHRRHGRPG